MVQLLVNLLTRIRVWFTSSMLIWKGNWRSKSLWTVRLVPYLARNWVYLWGYLLLTIFGALWLTKFTQKLRVGRVLYSVRQVRLLFLNLSCKVSRCMLWVFLKFLESIPFLLKRSRKLSYGWARRIKKNFLSLPRKMFVCLMRRGVLGYVEFLPWMIF